MKLRLSYFKIRPEKTFTVDEDGFYGSYFEPKKNLFPGKSLIVCSGADGRYGFVQMLAQIFRDAGMPAMAVGYWNTPGTPKEDLESPVEYIQYAARWIRENKHLHVGMWGISLGGEYALLCGSLLPEIECVIAVSPVHVVTECGSVNGGFHLTGGSPFSWKGKPVPYLSPSEEKKKEYARRVRENFKKRLEFFMRFYYEEQLMVPHDPEADIKVENIHGPVLLLSGGADTCVPAAWVCQQVMQRLKEHYFSYPAIHHNYKYLSHYVTPARPLSAGIFRVERKYKKECAKSRDKCWDDTLDFLRNKWIV